MIYCYMHCKRNSIDLTALLILNKEFQNVIKMIDANKILV